MDGNAWPLWPPNLPVLASLILSLACLAAAALVAVNRARPSGRSAEASEHSTSKPSTSKSGRATVADIMVPRDDIVGLDLDWPWDTVIEHVANSRHTRLPVWRGQIENIVGVLHLRRLVRHLTHDAFALDTLLELLEPPLFVPEGTTLNRLLARFRRERRGLALIVDEYGDLLGLVTQDDIVEEWVGQSGTDAFAGFTEIHPQPDGTVVIDGRAALRDINRSLGWDLPHEGPKTLNGLVLEHLEALPESHVCLPIGDYRIETLQMQGNAIRTLKIWRAGVSPGANGDSAPT